MVIYMDKLSFLGNGKFEDYGKFYRKQAEPPLTGRKCVSSVEEKKGEFYLVGS